MIMLALYVGLILSLDQLFEFLTGPGQSHPLAKIGGANCRGTGRGFDGGTRAALGAAGRLFVCAARAVAIGRGWALHQHAAHVWKEQASRQPRPERPLTSKSGVARRGHVHATGPDWWLDETQCGFPANTAQS